MYRDNDRIRHDHLEAPVGTQSPGGPEAAPPSSAPQSGFESVEDHDGRASETALYWAVNVLLAVVLGTMMWGLPVLFYAALAATPIALIVIVAMSLQRRPSRLGPP